MNHHLDNDKDDFRWAREHAMYKDWYYGIYTMILGHKGNDIILEMAANPGKGAIEILIDNPDGTRTLATYDIVTQVEGVQISLRRRGDNPKRKLTILEVAYATNQK